MEKRTETPNETFPDTLTQRIGVLARRETEARILTPIIDALGREFGRDEVIKVVSDTIVEIAQQQGAELTQTMGGCGSKEFTEALNHWKKDNALEMEILEQDAGQLNFNVTRCKYAEMYYALGIPELGGVLSCNRDHALIGGFNNDAVLERTQTIMEGAPHCDFRYRFPVRNAQSG